MRRPALEVGDILRIHDQAFAQRYGGSVSPEQWKVVRAIKGCRTKVLGGHVEGCDSCGHTRIAYNSCRNRHCPKCQAKSRAEWMAAREQELLPVPYFHVVFTIPDSLAPLALQNKRIVYDILFRAVAESLIEVARTPKHLGANIGFLAVLHTWGQNLMHHPHIHCVVPAGGLAPDGKRWIPCRRRRGKQAAFFLPVRVLSRVFRGKFIAKLKQAYLHGKLGLRNQLSSLNVPAQFTQLLNQAVRQDWVVYAKQPFGGPAQVLKYLARYTHRVAISNQRLIRMEGARVTFRWKDYAHGNQPRTMTLHACEFMRRFLMHTLPRGFVRIRHYGFLANRNRKENLERCRQLLEHGGRVAQNQEPTSSAEPTEERENRCPVCRDGRMFLVEHIDPQHSIVPQPHFAVRKQPIGFDTS